MRVLRNAQMTDHLHELVNQHRTLRQPLPNTGSFRANPSRTKKKYFLFLNRTLNGPEKVKLLCRLNWVPVKVRVGR